MNKIEKFDIILPRYIILIVCGVYIIIYTVTRATKNYKKYGTAREPKVPKTTMKERINADLETELPNIWLKEFEKKNKKREKKGKQPLRNEEFMDKLTKRYDYKRQKTSTIALTISGGVLGCGLVIALYEIGVLSVEEGVDFYANGFEIIMLFAFVVVCCLMIGMFISNLSKPSSLNLPKNEGL